MATTETFTVYNTLTGNSQTYHVPKTDKSKCKTFFVPLSEEEQRVIARCQGSNEEQTEK